MNSTHGGGSNNDDQMMQQRMGDPSLSGRAPPDAMNTNNDSNSGGAMATTSPQFPLQPPPNTTLSMTFPDLGNRGDQQVHGPGGNGSLLGPGSGAGGGQQQPPPPPPRCQVVNPFLGTPPLVPHDRTPGGPMQQGAVGGGGSSLGGPQNLMDNAFNPDMRHRAFVGVMNLPAPFQMHPNLQSQIQAFQQEVGQHGLMNQQQQQQQPPPGFLQSFIPSEIVSVPSGDSRGSQLLQPQVRQRARRRSRASRAASIQQQHVYEPAPIAASSSPGGGGDNSGGDAASATVLGRSGSREMPTAQITVDSAFAGLDNSGDSTPSMASSRGGLEDAKLKGLEENYTSIGENFECNICFQKANEPVVTCCGHLFCWPCLYRWLHIHSYHKECPVCKGAIDENTITPIYGRECSTLLSARGLSGGSAAERIPPRPPAHRVESARQLREREDRGREREQRERALERERERERELQQSENQIRSLAEALGQQQQQQQQGGVVTSLVADDADTAHVALASRGAAAGGGHGTSGNGMNNNQRDGLSSSTSSTAVPSVQGEAGGGGGGGQITISSTGRQQQQHAAQEPMDPRTSGRHHGHEDTRDSRDGSMHISHDQTPGPPGVNAATSSAFQHFSRSTGTTEGGGAPLAAQLQGGTQATGLGLEAFGGSNSSSREGSRGSGGTPLFLQRRASNPERREQLRAALAASARSGGGGGANSNLGGGARVDERRQMIAAAALLSQEWEDIVNISRLVGPVNPVEAAAWMAAVQGRLGSMEGSGPSVDRFGGGGRGDFPVLSHHPHQQQRDATGGMVQQLHHGQSMPRSRHHHIMASSPAAMIPAAADGGTVGGGDTSLGHLVAVNPLQAGDWLANMRSRLMSMEKIVENLESPLQVLQQHASAATTSLQQLNSNNNNVTVNLAMVPPAAAAQSSTLNTQGLVQTTSSSIGTDTIHGIDDLSFSALAQRPRRGSDIDTPSARAMQERAAAAAAMASEPAAGATSASASSSSAYGSGSSPMRNSTPRTHSEPRLHYREAPVPNPQPPPPPKSNRRRSSSRTGGAGGGEEGPTSNASSGSAHDHTGSGCSSSSTGTPETISSKSKRRRLD